MILGDHITFQETGKRYQLFWVPTVSETDLDDHCHYIFEHRLSLMLVYLVLQSAAWDANHVRQNLSTIDGINKYRM